MSVSECFHVLCFDEPPKYCTQAFIWRPKQTVPMCCSEVMKYIRHEEKNSCAHVLKMTFTRCVYNESCVLYSCWHVGRQSLHHAKKVSCAHVLTTIFTRCVYNQSCVLYNCWHVGRQSLHHVQFICWNFLGLWLLKHSEICQITYRQWHTNFLRRRRKPKGEKLG